MTEPAIQIVEVGPRDGLQNEKVLLSRDDKLEFIARLTAAGVRRLEVTSFVHPGRVPQMADAEAVVQGLPEAEGQSRIGLVLNMRGFERAVAAGVDEVTVSVSATDGFGLKNQGLSVAQQMDMLAEVVARSQAMEASGQTPPRLGAIISTVWGCPFDGEVSVDQVHAVVADIAGMGLQEIGLADTIGVGDPWAVRRKVAAAREAMASVGSSARLRLHFHDTRNTGLANAYAGIEAGVTVLDSSTGGIGGCPFAPGASGNLATEDLVYALDRAGIQTGLDLDRLIETARWIGDRLGRPRPSALSRAGGFPAP